MSSEIRVNSLTNRSGLSTVSITDTGVVFSGIVTANNFKTGTTNIYSTGISGGDGVFTGDLSVSGNVSIAGTLTYEDVTSVDSVGIVTAGNGLRVTDGGLVVTAGVSTFAGITTVTGETLFTKQLNVSGVSTLGSNVVVVGDALINGLTVGGGNNSQYNTAVGAATLSNNTIGSHNTGVGSRTLMDNTTGSDNVAVGNYALEDNDTGDKNTGIGQFALKFNATGDNNTACGSAALRVVTGSNNTAIGKDAGYYIEGDNNTILGAYKGTSDDSTLNNTVIISAGTTERLRITSDGTVLMGGQTASYDGAFVNLELRKDSTTVGGSMTLVNDQSATAGATCQIDCYQNFRGAGKIVFGRENANNWQSSAAGAASFLAFYTNNAGTEAERVRISSQGYVTKPSTPAFLAYHQTSDLNYGVGSTLAYAYTLYNTGNHYNTSNYTFTAPVAGRYLFSANANANYQSGVSGIPRAYWKVNGNNIANSIHLRGSDADHDGLEQRSQTVILNLSANDTVKIVVGQNRWDLFGANSFTGYLIG